MVTPAERYAARIDAVQAQQTRIYGEPPPRREGLRRQVAQSFRVDPRRRLSANLDIIASYIQPEDVVLDVGGGAGRIGLPLALRCREVINVDPSVAMLEEFQASASEAGTSNVRAVQAGWLEAKDIEGDLAIVSQVTYFVRDIQPFVEKLAAAARRRVVIAIWSVPAPSLHGDPFRLLFDEELALAPGHRELLPVLWGMGLLPEVRVLPESFTGNAAYQGPGGHLPQTRDEALDRVLHLLAPPWFWERRGPAFETRARTLMQGHLDEYVSQIPEGYALRKALEAREVLITWETGQARR